MLFDCDGVLVDSEPITNGVLRDLLEELLQDLGGAAVGVEFATPSVTSPGIETFFPNEEPKAFAGALAQLIGPLVYADTSQRGFMVLTATPTEARADWTYVSTISSRSYTSSTQRSLKTLPGSGNRKIVEV